jgi:hypothetical protein
MLISVATRSGIEPLSRWQSWLAGLFEQAHRLGRRRRRRQLVLVALVVFVAVCAVELFDRGGGGGAGSTGVGSSALPRFVVSSRSLPAIGGGPLLSVAGGRLIVSDNENDSFSNDRVTGTCAAATVDPITLRVVSTARGNCGDPALYGQRVLPIVYQLPQSLPIHGVFAPLVMRIAVVDRAARGGYRLGPVIVTYPAGSDTHAETIYGDGSLWVYVPVVGARSNYGELLRVSPASGGVAERWRTPPISRALLATNADGLWLAPSLASGSPDDITRARQVADSSLYRIAPGMRVPQRVFDLGPIGARWLAASGHSVWMDVGPASESHLWGFGGATAKPIIRGKPTRASIADCGDIGDGSVTVLGAPSGVYCVNTGSYRESVSMLTPAGHQTGVVAAVSTPIQWDFADSAVTYKGAYYFVDPAVGVTPTYDRDETRGSEPTIYRVGPRA